MNKGIHVKIALIVFSIATLVLILIGYRLLYVADVSEYAKEFTAGCIGAFLTIIATWLLLKAQTDSDITKEQISGIFKEKLDIYRQFIAFLNKIHTDGSLSHEEKKQFAVGAGNKSQPYIHVFIP